MADKKKYVHHIVFVTELTGELILHDTFESDDSIPLQHEMQECTKTFMSKYYKVEVLNNTTGYRIAIKNLSTFKN